MIGYGEFRPPATEETAGGTPDTTTAPERRPSAALFAPAELIWARILTRIDVQPDGCWLWTGALNSQGYGCISSGRRSRTVLVHRVSRIVRLGSIPDGHVADHTCHDPRTCPDDVKCRHRRCVNPDHLEPVTSAENSRRGAQQARSTCKRNHPLGFRIRGGKLIRFCRRCEYDAKAARRDQQRVSA